MGHFAHEDVVTVGGVTEDQRQHDDRADQKQGLRLGCGSSLMKRNFEGHHVGPDADPYTEITR